MRISQDRRQPSDDDVLPTTRTGGGWGGKLPFGAKRESYVYDLAGNLHQKTDFNGKEDDDLRLRTRRTGCCRSHRTRVFGVAPVSFTYFAKWPAAERWPMRRGSDGPYTYDNAQPVDARKGRRLRGTLKLHLRQRRVTCWTLASDECKTGAIGDVHV